MISFEAVLFDVDDTLFDRRAAFEKWLNQYIHNILCRSGDKIQNKILRRIDHFDGVRYGSKKELIENVIELFPPPTGSTYNASIAYSEFFELNTLSSDAVAVLDFLDQLHFPFGIVTNGTKRQLEKVQKLGLFDRTPCVFISDIFGCAKPDKPIFLAAADCLRYAPQQILFVGDNPINDIYGAGNAGMRTAWLPNNQPWPTNLPNLKPHITLTRLTELIPYLMSCK
jgi:putative hydrolase of the HAD superfamily